MPLAFKRLSKGFAERGPHGLAGAGGFDKPGVALLERSHAAAKVGQLGGAEVIDDLLHRNLERLAGQRLRQELLDDFDFTALADRVLDAAFVIMLAGRSFALKDEGFEHAADVFIRAAGALATAARADIPVTDRALDEAQGCPLGLVADGIRFILERLQNPGSQPHTR